MTVSLNYCAELTQLLQQRRLTSVFQPIINLKTSEVIGHEALIRGPSDSPLHAPVSLFRAAVLCNKLEELEMLCRQISIETFAHTANSGLLFLNVNPLLLLTADHPSGLTRQLLEKVALSPSQVVIEISEEYQVEDPSLLITAVSHYRELGFSIAIDDLGSGFSGLKLWSELKPDIVKIDRYFISQLHTDPTKRTFVRNIIALAQATGAKVVAEGIETHEELLLCQSLGADYAQGYLLGRPMAKLATTFPGQYLLSKPQAVPQTAQYERVDSIMLSQPAVDIQLNAAQVMALFNQHPQLSSLAVVERDRAVGIVDKNQLQALFSHPYGRALYEKKAIGLLMQQDPVVVDETTALDEVSQLVTDGGEQEGGWYFIITSDQRYIGMGSVRDLLRRITERKLQHARYANPLTLLPGNVPVYQEIARLLAEKASFSIAYADLNHFKPFNDCYSYSRGDLVIQLLAEVISQHANAPGNFMGHIGGDDFVMLFRTGDAVNCCHDIVEVFHKRVLHYYSSQDIEQGGISSVSRTGEACFYPVLTLAIGIVSPDPALCINHHDVAALASAAKHEAKKLNGGGVFVSRRRGPSDAYNALARPSAD